MAKTLFNIGIQDILNISDNQNISFLKYLQIVQSVGLFIIPPFLIGYLFNRNSFSYLKLNIKPQTSLIIAVVVLMICAIPVINLFAEINARALDYIFSPNNWMKNMEEVAMKTTEAFLKVDTTNGLLINIIIIAIIPAIGEELVFRGVFQKIFINWSKNIHFGVIFSAILFSAIHMQFYGFLPRFLMGLLFGYLFVWSGSIWLPIAAHFTNNAFAVIVSYFINIESLSKDIETVGMDFSTIIYAIVSIIIVSILLYLIFKKGKRKL